MIDMGVMWIGESREEGKALGGTCHNDKPGQNGGDVEGIETESTCVGSGKRKEVGESGREGAIQAGPATMTSRAEIVRECRGGSRGMGGEGGTSHNG